MSEQVLIWIMGICVVLLAAAMATQAAAGFAILRTMKPFFFKYRQLMGEGKNVVDISKQLFRETKPKATMTGKKARDLAKITAEHASEWKTGTKEIIEPFARYRKGSEAKPQNPPASDLETNEISE